MNMILDTVHLTVVNAAALVLAHVLINYKIIVKIEKRPSL